MAGLLASHPRIDPKRIAVMGFSRGGITAVRSGVVRIADNCTDIGGHVTVSVQR